MRFATPKVLLFQDVIKIDIKVKRKKRLGKGSYGEVYEAYMEEDRQGRTPIALKHVSTYLSCLSIARHFFDTLLVLLNHVPNYY